MFSGLYNIRSPDWTGLIPLSFVGQSNFPSSPLPTNNHIFLPTVDVPSALSLLSKQYASVASAAGSSLCTMRRKITSLLASSLVLTALTVFIGFRQFSDGSYFDYGRAWTSGLHFLASQSAPNATGERTGMSNNTGLNCILMCGHKAAEKSAQTPFGELNQSLKDGNSTLLEMAPAYIKAIMTPEDISFSRLNCPTPTGDRYKYLRSNSTTIPTTDARPKYFFALDLHQCASLLPRLIGSIVETMNFLGPENCVLSIVEGRSDDGTFEIMKLLRPEIEGIGAKYFFNSSDLNPTAGDRISILAKLRNQALEPLINHPSQYSASTTVLFINDVSICMEDILELIYQRVYQNAEMTCGMDWTYVGPDPTFYDVWVARGMTGDSFFNIPEDGNWNSAWNLFWNDPESLARFNAHKPFQVFSCWNGAVAFTAKLLWEQKIKFRSKFGDECFQGEPQLFCKEMWHLGHGKIAVVPAVNIEYSDEAAQKIKALKGYVSQWVNKDGDNDDPSMQIEWETNPPPLIKCMSPLGNQTWLPWNYQLV